MNSACHSLSSAAATCRAFPLRFLRGTGRFFWNRRMVSALAILVSLLVLLYQYENWNGVRELKAARTHLLAVAGTADFMTLLPPTVPEEENLFGIPVIQSWRRPDENAGCAYVWPGSSVLSGVAKPPLKEEPGRSTLDLTGWTDDRSPSGQTPQDRARAFYAAIGDGGGVITQLIAGLDRPYCQPIPSRRRLIEEAGGHPAKSHILAMSACFTTWEGLGIHLRASALARDAVRTRDLAGVMLRLADGVNSDLSLVGSLVGMAGSGITFSALNEALACPALQDADYRRIQDWLRAGNDDVEQIRKVFLSEAMSTEDYFAGCAEEFRRAAPARAWSDGLFWQSHFILQYGPSGWYDANLAFAIENWLRICGDQGEEGWRSMTKGLDRMNQNQKDAVMVTLGKSKILNPRRTLGTAVLPAMSGIWRKAAVLLFQRRCAILTCALHRHRLAHGTFPVSLKDLDSGLLPSPLTDPAKAGEPIGYKQTAGGFLLWSAGEDRNDDGGDAKKDWLWRHVAQ